MRDQDAALAVNGQVAILLPAGAVLMFRTGFGRRRRHLAGEQDVGDKQRRQQQPPGAGRHRQPEHHHRLDHHNHHDGDSGGAIGAYVLADRYTVAGELEREVGSDR